MFRYWLASGFYLMRRDKRGRLNKVRRLHPLFPLFFIVTSVGFLITSMLTGFKVYFNKLKQDTVWW